MDTPKYPHVEVSLSDCDGNAFYILGRCTAAAKSASPRLSPAEIQEFLTEAQSGDYEQLLGTVSRWFEVV